MEVGGGAYLVGKVQAMWEGHTFCGRVRLVVGKRRAVARLTTAPGAGDTVLLCRSVEDQKRKIMDRQKLLLSLKRSKEEREREAVAARAAAERAAAEEEEEAATAAEESGEGHEAAAAAATAAADAAAALEASMGPEPGILDARIFCPQPVCVEIACMRLRRPHGGLQSMRRAAGDA